MPSASSEMVAFFASAKNGAEWVFFSITSSSFLKRWDLDWIYRDRADGVGLVGRAGLGGMGFVVWGSAGWCRVGVS